MRIGSSPVYIDTSALVKLYVAEPESDELEAALVERSDLLVSELAVTEFTSVIARRVREGDVPAAEGRRLYRRIVRDIEGDGFIRIEITPAAHREAERLLMGIGRSVAVRAADALHLAMASLGAARVLITFDRRMRAVAETLGTFEIPAAG